MNSAWKSTLLAPLALSSAALLCAPAAQAGGKIQIGPQQWVSVGAGLRTSFNMVEDAAPSGSDYSKDFELDSMRLYINGQALEQLYFTFNTERDAGNGDAARVLDAIARFEFSDGFNIWAGRFLPPSDRSNLDGPYYLNAWDFPFVQAYPAIFAGRDDGVAVWGQTGGGKFKYQAGLFEGRQGGANESDNFLLAGRLTYNFWDPEPGYYNSSTYYGAKDVLAFGVAMMSQADGAGTAVTPGDFTGWSVDLLAEKKLANGGVPTFEAAYYDYSTDDVADAALTQGSSYFVLASYLLPTKLGIGQLQPMVRYQNFDVDGGDEHQRYEAGVHYVIDGQNARVSVIYANDDPGGAADSFGIFKVGLQVQI